MINPWILVYSISNFKHLQIIIQLLCKLMLALVRLFSPKIFLKYIQTSEYLWMIGFLLSHMCTPKNSPPYILHLTSSMSLWKTAVKPVYFVYMHIIIILNINIPFFMKMIIIPLQPMLGPHSPQWPATNNKIFAK